MEKMCAYCQIIFTKSKYISLKEWENKTKYCSRQCFGLDRKGKHYGVEGEFRKGFTPWNKGKFDLTTKYGIHNWTKQTLGKPKNCEKCGSNFYVEWANKSQQYKAEKDDWMRLCRNCHMEYDRQFGIRNKFYGGRWKGGKPKCIDCSVRLSHYLAKRCRKCNGKIQSISKKGLHFSPSTEFKKKSS